METAGSWFFLLGSLRRGFSHRESKKCGMAEYGTGLVLFDFHFRPKRLAAFPCQISRDKLTSGSLGGSAMKMTLLSSWGI